MSTNPLNVPSKITPAFNDSEGEVDENDLLDMGESAPHRRLPAPKRRRLLLDAALETFASRGYDATTMEDIAEAAGVTKPLLYQHFDSKRALYLEIIQDISMRLIGHVSAATSASGSPRQQVEQGFGAYFSFAIQHESAFRLLFGRSAPHDDELSKALRNVEDRIAITLAPLIDVDVTTSHRRLLAHAVIGMAEGASRYWLSPLPEDQERSDNLNSKTNKEYSTNETSAELALWVANLAWAGLRGIKPDHE